MHRVTIMSAEEVFAINGVFLTGSKNDIKRNWIGSKRLYLANIRTIFGSVKRVLTPIMIDGKHGRRKRKILLMDCITGSIYNRKSGICYSSEQIYIESFARNEMCTAILMSSKSEGGAE